MEVLYFSKFLTHAIVAEKDKQRDEMMLREFQIQHDFLVGFTIEDLKLKKTWRRMQEEDWDKKRREDTGTDVLLKTGSSRFV